MSGLSMALRLSGCLLLAACLTALHCLSSAWGQAPAIARESAVKAAFLHKFAGFVEWPSGAIGGPDQPVLIGIIGNDAVAADLEQIIQAQATDSGHTILRRLRDGDGAADLHILFIGASRETRVREIVAGIHGPVLIVTEQEDGLRLGGILNFVIDSGRVRFAASVAAAEARGLRLGARLLAVAQSVEGRSP